MGFFVAGTFPISELCYWHNRPPPPPRPNGSRSRSILPYLAKSFSLQYLPNPAKPTTALGPRGPERHDMSAGGKPSQKTPVKNSNLSKGSSCRLQVMVQGVAEADAFGGRRHQAGGRQRRARNRPPTTHENPWYQSVSKSLPLKNASDAFHSCVQQAERKWSRANVQLIS